MNREWGGCGQTFETLTRLRLYDCPTSKPSEADWASGIESESSEGDGTTVRELENFVERVDEGDFEALHQAVATYETALHSALDVGDLGDTYRDVFWEYYEPLAEGLDRAVRTEGWSFLQEFVEAYDSVNSDEAPLATPVIENAMGRHIARTRQTEGVSSVPSVTLDYLYTVAVETEDDDVVFEESQAYGWGIGHPEHDAADRIHARRRGHSSGRTAPSNLHSTPTNTPPSTLSNASSPTIRFSRPFAILGATLRGTDFFST